MGDGQRNNVHYLDEWRTRQRSRRRMGTSPPGSRRRGRNVHSSFARHARPAPHTSRRSAVVDDSRSLYVVNGRRPRFSRRRVPPALLWISAVVTIVGLLALWSARTSRAVPLEEMPPVIRLWATIDDGRIDELAEVVYTFEREHGVRVEVTNRLPPVYDLVPTLMAGHGPDVMLIDGRVSMHLLSTESLHPLRDEDERLPPEEELVADDAGMYILPLADETLWVHALRAVIPVHSRNVDAARRFVNYIASSDVRLPPR